VGTNVRSIMMKMGNGHYKKVSGEELKGKMKGRRNNLGRLVFHALLMNSRPCKEEKSG